MCEHEKSTPLHLVKSLAYHARLITAASSACGGHARTSVYRDKDGDNGGVLKQRALLAETIKKIRSKAQDLDGKANAFRNYH